MKTYSSKHYNSWKKLTFWLVLLSGFILIATSCGKNANNDSNSISNIFEIDPTFREFYEHLGGEDVMGKPDGWAAVNANADQQSKIGAPVDADRLAQKISNPRAVNLIVLGWALKTAERASSGKSLFCSYEDIKSVLKNRFGSQKKMLRASLKALEAGYNAKEK